ncbi:hypothetical protein [Bacillus thuringiensis]|uniref:hypothetical protein n=1 Tax=Bacillus thuringiensis TaxID=1428 RepID=UPI0005CF6DF7|nr:hypothetical protein [Bacillus thuringiensis]
MARKKYIVTSKEQLINEIDRRIVEGENAKTIAYTLGINIGIVQEFVRLTKIKHRQDQEALQVKEIEYLNCFDDYFNKLNTEKHKRE